MIEAPYLLYDVFTDSAFTGNQLAIFPELAVDAATMQRIARELNLAESVFLSGSGDGAAAALRIFTPARELAFAGHPTIGAAIALVERLGWIAPAVEHFTLREGIGDVEIAVERRTPTTAWLRTPAVTFGAEVARERAARLVGLAESDLRADVPAQVAGAGNPFLYLPLRGAEPVDRAVADVAALRAFASEVELSGVYLFAQSGVGAYVRMVAPLLGVPEDPATGSAAGPLYAYLAKHRAVPRRDLYVIEQGVQMGRRSSVRVRLHWDGETLQRIDVGGGAVLVGEGRLFIP